MKPFRDHLHCKGCKQSYEKIKEREKKGKRKQKEKEGKIEVKTKQKKSIPDQS